MTKSWPLGRQQEYFVCSLFALVASVTSTHWGCSPDIRDLLSQAKVSYHRRVAIFIPLYQAVLGFPKKKTVWLRSGDQPAIKVTMTAM